MESRSRARLSDFTFRCDAQHNVVSDIELLCKRIVMIDKGKIVYDGDIDAMKDKFGKMREMNLTLFDVSDVAKINVKEKFRLTDDDFAMETVKDKVNIKINTSKVNMTDTLTYHLHEVHVKDINVKDADIEEIIMRIYKSGVM